MLCKGYPFVHMSIGISHGIMYPWISSNSLHKLSSDSYRKNFLSKIETPSHPSSILGCGRTKLVPFILCTNQVLIKIYGPLQFHTTHFVLNTLTASCSSSSPATISSSLSTSIGSSTVTSPYVSITFLLKIPHC